MELFDDFDEIGKGLKQKISSDYHINIKHRMVM